MIDNATVRRIIDTADIVEVVSDFVTLRKRGQNYVGLCPFHNDRSPSFYVSKSKQLCKCFSCGEGGSPVNFIMKHQSMSYVDALRYLALKYHIEIQEREMTDEERESQRKRDSLLMVNEWACKFFEEQLHATSEGQEVGLSYFTERGFSATTIKSFRLGYSPEGRTALYDAATKHGFSHELLIETGLCVDDNRGGGYDRYRGRVIFPIMNVAGMIVAFGGRTLKNDKKIAKYVNSPESIIYSKRKELYGLFQAKREISKNGKCFIVEGYADVISMHQSGFKNVIASSGTALTDEHIHLLHRFTDNVTEMFDGDEAGIRAALKGIDKILAQGLNMKVLLLPDDDDPDSYSRKHSASEIQAYIDNNETDFITFKSNILLKDCGRDVIKRSQAIADITRSIAAIPSELTRSLYAKECSDLFGVDEGIILRDIANHLQLIRQQEFKRGKATGATNAITANDATNGSDNNAAAQSTEQVQQTTTQQEQPAVAPASNPYEKDLIKLIVKYGMCHFTSYFDENNEQHESTVLEYVKEELDFDHMVFTTPSYKTIYDTAVSLIKEFKESLHDYVAQVRQDGIKEFNRLYAEVDPVGHSGDSLKQESDRIQGIVDSRNNIRIMDYRTRYLMHILCSHPDDEVRDTSCELVTEKYSLSKIHTEFASIHTEQDRLNTLIPGAINNWKGQIVEERINDLTKVIAKTTNESELIKNMVQLQELYDMRSQLAKVTGNRVVTPK